MATTAVSAKAEEAATSAPEASPTVISPTTLISTMEQGWKITIKNADGTSNEVMIEPKATDEADPEKGMDEEEQPAPQSMGLRIYLIIQYVLNTILAIAIIAVMVLTLVKYNQTKNIKGAWPKNAIVSPTILMLAVSVVNVLVDAINLLVQCCGVTIIKTVANIVAKVRSATGFITAVMPAVAAGFSSFAMSTTNGNDLWGWSCSPAADAMMAVNASSTICSSNQTAWALQILQIVFQLLSVFIPIFASWRPADSPAADSKTGKPSREDPAKPEKGKAKKGKGGEEEATQLIDESKTAFTSFAALDMGMMSKK